MKRFAIAFGMMVSAASALVWMSDNAASALEVHEWGTFTIVQGSDGAALSWWSFPTGPAELPPFVNANLFAAKAMGSFVARMETPVVYFYPEKAMPVTMTVQYDSGKLTEWFPSPASNSAKGPVEWKVDLLPPEDAESVKVPSAGARGAHYAHAREVPDAWLVRRSGSAAAQVEKFVFYRGAGMHALPLTATQSVDGRVEVLAEPGMAVDKVWLVGVSDAGMTWSETSGLAQPQEGAPFRSLPLAALPAPRPLAVARAELEAHLADALHQAGLTTAEAAAMIATWRDAWLGEPGMRLFYVLPRPWVDRTLPLHIHPVPKKLERVFVGRQELITRAVEDELVALNDLEGDQKPLAGRLAALNLGRFTPAAIERVARMKEMQARTKLGKLAAEMPNSNSNRP